MPADPNNRAPEDETAFTREVAAKAARKLRVQRDGPGGIWFGLGMTGLIGWSVAVPTLVGALAGRWLDRNHPGAHSWTLALLAAGLCIGCANAWRWMVREDQAMHDKLKDDDE